MRKILKIDDVAVLRDYVSSDIYTRLHANRHACWALPEGAFLITFHFCDAKYPLQKDDKVCIYCRADTFILISDNARCSQIISEIDENLDGNGQLLDFLFNLTANDVNELEKLEDRITDIEDILLTDKKTKLDISANIIRIRRELLKLKRYYEQLSLITGDLSENTNKAFSDEMEKRFAYLERRMDYRLNSVLHLREYITQVREAYQAHIDIEQNQLMKVFTVITSVFLPLTLIVGWYGMNLQMPEFDWSFGYPFVIILSAVVCIASIVIFKIKKLF